MTVRWKPLILLSALFLIVGLMGVIAHHLRPLLARPTVERPPGPGPRRLEGEAVREGRKSNSSGPSRSTPRIPVVHEELARMYADWADAVPDELPATPASPADSNASWSEATKCGQADAASTEAAFLAGARDWKPTRWAGSGPSGLES